jgi:DNA primase
MNASSKTWQLGNQVVQVSRLEKVNWPRARFTKGELLDYYRQIAPVLLPYLKDRPVTLRMCPQGVEGTSYYLRDCPADAPKWLRRVPYQPKTVSHPVPLPLIDTAASYTLRAHPDHPTVSTPLTWEELDAGSMHPALLSPQVVLERVSRMGDPFSTVLQADQRIDEL